MWSHNFVTTVSVLAGALVGGVACVPEHDSGVPYGAASGASRLDAAIGDSGTDTAGADTMAGSRDARGMEERPDTLEDEPAQVLESPLSSAVSRGEDGDISFFDTAEVAARFRAGSPVGPDEHVSFDRVRVLPAVFRQHEGLQAWQIEVDLSDAESGLEYTAQLRRTSDPADGCDLFVLPAGSPGLSGTVTLGRLATGEYFCRVAVTVGIEFPSGASGGFSHVWSAGGIVDGL